MDNSTKNSQIQSELSIERTILANNRTLLAYLRSAAGLLVAGAGLMKFIQTAIWVYVGIGCVILAPTIMILGIIDYFKVRNLIKREQEMICRNPECSEDDIDSNCA